MSNVLVTGGASGLGEAITRKFLEDKGNRVYFTFCRSGPKAAKLTSEHPNAVALHCDFLDAYSMADLLQTIPSLNLDILINNALPSFARQHFHKIPKEYFLKNFEENVLPTLLITQAAIREFRKRRFGRIVTVLTSYLLDRPPIGMTAYVANKAYLESAFKSWAVENVDYNITSNAVSPSFMLTGLTSDIDERVLEELLAREPSGRFLTVTEVATAIASLLNSLPETNGINHAIAPSRNAL